MALVLEQGRQRLQLLLVRSLVANHKAALCVASPGPHVSQVLVELMRNGLERTFEDLIVRHRGFLDDGSEDPKLKLWVAEQGKYVHQGLDTFHRCHTGPVVLGGVHRRSMELDRRGVLRPEPLSDGIDPGFQPVCRTFEHSKTSQDKELGAGILRMARLVEVQEMHRWPRK